MLHAMQATLPYQQAALYIGTKDLSCIVRCLQCALLRLGFVCIVPAPMSLRHQHLPEDFMAVCGTPLVGGLHELEGYDWRLTSDIALRKDGLLAFTGPLCQCFRGVACFHLDMHSEHSDFCPLTCLTST
jgi:hypothetical protein